MYDPNAKGPCKKPSCKKHSGKWEETRDSQSGRCGVQVLQACKGDLVFAAGGSLVPGRKPRVGCINLNFPGPSRLWTQPTVRVEVQPTHLEGLLSPLP